MEKLLRRELYISVFATVGAWYLESLVMSVIWLKGCTVLILPCQMWTHCSLDEHSYLTPHYSTMKTSRQSDYFPDFGLSRQGMYSHSLVKSPQEGIVSVKHRLLLIYDSHASHLLV